MKKPEEKDIYELVVTFGFQSLPVRLAIGYNLAHDEWEAYYKQEVDRLVNERLSKAGVTDEI